MKTTLDEEKTVQQNVSEYDTIPINGQPRHIIGYLQDFLFPPERSRSLVRLLSGGERSRLLLAKLFTRPSNVLVLDEPTNDLDVETLELLESLLVEYQGTVLLVSHDRAFLNNVVTSTLVIEADGRVKEYDGGYDDYVRQRQAEAAGRAEASLRPCLGPREGGEPAGRAAPQAELQGEARAGGPAGPDRGAGGGAAGFAPGDGRPGILPKGWSRDRRDQGKAGGARGELATAYTRWEAWRRWQAEQPPVSPARAVHDAALSSPAPGLFGRGDCARPRCSGRCFGPGGSARLRKSSPG